MQQRGHLLSFWFFWFPGCEQVFHSQICFHWGFLFHSGHRGCYVQLFNNCLLFLSPGIKQTNKQTKRLRLSPYLTGVFMSKKKSIFLFVISCEGVCSQPGPNPDISIQFHDILRCCEHSEIFWRTVLGVWRTSSICYKHTHDLSIQITLLF